MKSVDHKPVTGKSENSFTRCILRFFNSPPLMPVFLNFLGEFTLPPIVGRLAPNNIQVCNINLTGADTADSE